MKAVEKCAKLYAISYRYAYKFWGLPFGHKQMDVYSSDYLDQRRRYKKNSARRDHLAEVIKETKSKLKGDN